MARTVHDIHPDVAAAWLEEAQRRYEDLHSGNVKAIPADEVIRKARAGLKQGLGDR